MEFERNKSLIPEEPCQNIANDTDDITSKGIRVLPFDRCTDECQSSTKRQKKIMPMGKISHQIIAQVIHHQLEVQ